ncbi:AAA family ATPase [Bradyrhizobium sp. SZCCHNRI2014]|uniref:AAA family ATPase n=1 Tax=Bradyrhizobium sp. SZCCHNRI2014 TaxID=3057285 RepID=UPI0029160CCF|nr:AAA family ATPase [Bradyrhizobium sp. SZCCHNRI2014]
MSWEQKYRPQRFSEVRGQDHTVRLLSALSAKRTLGRHLLLYGAVGSGKTSLAQLFSRALNCSAVQHDGSPCGRCGNCCQPRRYHFEVDVPGRSGEDLVSWARTLVHSHSESRVRVLFFDEAHALSKATQNGLLKLIEDSPAGVKFFFATSEAQMLSAALVSRLTELRIHALTPNVAFELLEYIAEQEQISYEPEALHLLIAAKPPFARDLTIALQQLHDRGGRVGVELVKSVYDLSVCDHIRDYCMALASSDRGLQANALRRWPAQSPEKVRWIRLFLATTYYNDVLGQLLPMDSLVQSMVAARRDFVTRLCERFDLADRSHAEPLMRRMLEFWSQPTPQDDEAAELKLLLFEAFVASELTPPLKKSRQRDQDAERPKRSPVGADTLGSENSRATSPYIETEEIRQVVNRASFFVQHHGVPMNVAFRILVQSEVSDLERLGAEAIAGFCVDLESQMGPEGSNFGAISVIERDGGQIVGRVIAHIDGARIGGLEGFRAARARRFGHLIDVSTCEGAEPMAFHWQNVRELCAGINRSDGDGSGEKDLRQLLRIPRARWRSPGPFSYPRTIFSGRLSDRSIAEACEYGMAPLSAFDATQWHWLYQGWEIREFQDRSSEIAQRRQEVAAIEGHARHDFSQLERLSDLKSLWQQMTPEQRLRRWRGWW